MGLVTCLEKVVTDMKRDNMKFLAKNLTLIFYINHVDVGKKARLEMEGTEFFFDGSWWINILIYRGSHGGSGIALT